MSFITPLFLIGLSAALLPVLFHFVRKMRAKTIPFSSLMFLKATPEERVKKRRLKDILLMATRAALIALLALAFARPFIPKEALPFSTGAENQSTVLLIDQSYSMQQEGVFDTARQTLLDYLTSGESDDEYALVAFSNEAQRLTALSSDLALHQAALDQLSAPGNRATDFFPALRLAEDLLQDARHTTKRIILVSDFQRSGWSRALENWKLNPEISFVPVQVGPEDPSNRYVQAFNLSQKRSGTQVGLRFDARLGVHPSAAAERMTVTLSTQDTPDQREQAPARSEAPVSFQHVAPRTGLFQGTLQLPADALPVDDTYYFTYQVEDRPALLCIDEGRGLNDAYFLQRAFDQGAASLYAYNSGNLSQLTPGSLRRYNVVFLPNNASLNPAQRRALQNFVGDGGTLILSFGNRTQVAETRTLLHAFSVGRAERLVNARAEQTAEAILGEVDMRHPIFEVFGGSGSALLRPRFRQYLEITPDSATTVIGTYDSDAPFLLERDMGLGKVLVYTATWNTDWTDLPIQELYIPMLYQIALHATANTRPSQYTVGDVVHLSGQPGTVWDVQAPGNRLYKVPVDSQGTGFFRTTDAPGHYQAALAGQRIAFSVNVDPAEAVLDRRDAEEVYAAVVPTTRDLSDGPQTTAVLNIEDEEKRQKFWRVLILLVLGLFAFETYYAHRS